MKPAWLILLGLTLSCGRPEPKIDLEDSQPTQLAGFSTNATLHTFEFPSPTDDTPLTFLALHHNEDTSIAITKEIIKERGGKLVVLANEDGKRLIKFRSGIKTYKIDPNRIFTDEGIRKTLERNNRHSYSERTVRRIKMFGLRVLQSIDLNRDEGQIPDQVLSLHNNTEGRLSIESFLPGGSEASNALSVHINESNQGLTTDPDNFYYLTNPTHFEFLETENLNTVLQDPDNMIDDGSLSIYCALNEISYINIEAQHGHHAVQRGMIEYLYEMSR